ncbi:hypothetical protein J2S21_000231 [Peribacillus cavernae]|nr:hypothetical protein [Peribacillus cavernae]
MSEEFMKLHYNNMDIASKSLEMQSIGLEPFGFLGVHSDVVKQVLSNEFLKKYWLTQILSYLKRNNFFLCIILY